MCGLGRRKGDPPSAPMGHRRRVESRAGPPRRLSVQCHPTGTSLQPTAWTARYVLVSLPIGLNGVWLQGVTGVRRWGGGGGGKWPAAPPGRSASLNSSTAGARYGRSFFRGWISFSSDGVRMCGMRWSKCRPGVSTYRAHRHNGKRPRRERERAVCAHGLATQQIDGSTVLPTMNPCNALRPYVQGGTPA